MKRPVSSWCLGLALVPGIVLAEAAPPTTEEAFRELKASFDRNPGYHAVYRSTGRDKMLEYRMAVDAASGLAASHMTATKGGEKWETRMWNTADDRLYVHSNGELKVARGLLEELSSLFDLIGKTSPRLEPPAKPRMYQYLLLGETTFEAGLGFNYAAGNPWLSGLDPAEVGAADAESITFDSKKKGFLTFDRATGLLKRQTIRGGDGEERVLLLAELRNKPGRETVEEMTRDWPTLGAKGMDVAPLMTPMRLMMFQQVIHTVENGDADLGKLETTLQEQNEVTRRFVQCCLSGRTNSAPLARWREMPLPDKDKIREMWLKSVPGARAGDAEGFQRFLDSSTMRKQFRDTMVESFLNVDGAVGKTLSDLLGDGVWKQLKARDESGRAARELLGKALCRAFLEVMIERRINQLWGDPQGLD